MKTIKMQVLQNIDGLSNEFTQTFDLTNENFETIIGTALNRLFEYQSTLKEINDKGAFKCTKPMILNIETGREFISTEDLPIERQKGLLIGNTAKGKKRFSVKVYKLLKFIYSNTRELTYSEYISELDAQISE